MSSYASTDWETIQDKLRYIDNYPFAVRYSIVDKDTYNNNRRKAYYNGEFDNYSKEEKLEVARQPGNMILKDECIYISDGQGQERFQYTRQNEPIDINLYPDYISSQKESITLLSNYAVLRYFNDRKNDWNRGVHIQDPDGRINPESGLTRFPLCGLFIIAWEKPRCIKSLPETVKTILEKEGLLNKPLDCIDYYLDLSNLRVEIEWGKDNPIPTEIRYFTKDGQYSRRFTIFETGETSEGYIYPKKAKMCHFRHLDADHLFRETIIEVKEILIGPEALDKYPLLLPAPEDPLILDERNNKSQELDLSFMNK